MRHPDCTHDPDECRITCENSRRTGKEVCDGYGRVVEPVSTHEEYECDTCGLAWAVDNGVVGEAKTKPKPRAAVAAAVAHAAQAQTQSHAPTKHS